MANIINNDDLFEIFCKAKSSEANEYEQDVYLEKIQYEDNHLWLLEKCKKEFPEQWIENLEIITNDYIFYACPDVIRDRAEQEINNRLIWGKFRCLQKAAQHKLDAINRILENEYAEERDHFEAFGEPLHYYEEPRLTSYVPFLCYQKILCEEYLEKFEPKTFELEHVKFGSEITSLLFYILQRRNIIKYTSAVQLSNDIERLTGWKANQAIEMLSEKGIERFLSKKNKNIVRRNIEGLNQELRTIVKMLENYSDSIKE